MAQQISDATLADYIAAKVDAEASDLWLDGDFNTEREPDESKMVSDANVWLKEKGISITLISVDFTNEADGPDGIMWEMSDEDAEKVQEELNKE